MSECSYLMHNCTPQGRFPREIMRGLRAFKVAKRKREREEERERSTDRPTETKTEAVIDRDRQTETQTDRRRKTTVQVYPNSGTLNPTFHTHGLCYHGLSGRLDPVLLHAVIIIHD